MQILSLETLGTNNTSQMIENVTMMVAEMIITRTDATITTAGVMTTAGVTAIATVIVIVIGIAGTTLATGTTPAIRTPVIDIQIFKGLTAMTDMTKIAVTIETEIATTAVTGETTARHRADLRTILATREMIEAIVRRLLGIAVRGRLPSKQIHTATVRIDNPRRMEKLSL